MQTITRRGKRFVLLEETEYKRLVRNGSDREPELPQSDADGDVPAAEYVRALIARDFIRARRAAGLTQSELADLAGVRVETINRLERGKHTPDVATVEKIDRA